jgi:hypothetical protein
MRDRTPDATAAFREGDRIGYEGVIGGWCFGTIAEVVEEGYRVSWDDGFDESGNPPYSDAELVAYSDVPEDLRG